MSSFCIKVIACITMVLDHIKYVSPIFRNFFTEYLGRFSFPLFAFLTVQAYCHTSDLKKYYKRLILFAIISQIPFMFFRTLIGEWRMLNILFTLLFGVVCINIYDKVERKYIALPLMIAIIVLGNFVNVDYGWFGITTIIIMYLLKDKIMFLPLIYGILVFIFYYTFQGKEYIFETETLLQMLFTWLSTFLINQYNGEKGKGIKYFFYWFYPIHMLAVYLLSLIM